MSNEQTNTETAAVTTVTAKAETVPAYQKLCAAIESACADLGVPMQRFERKNFVGFESAVNKHKFYVPKNAGEVGWCHTTLLLDREAGLVQDLPKGPGSIGKIETFVKPDIDLIVDRVLPLMTASESRLRENRKPARKADSQATPSEPATRPAMPEYGI
jgi:hypothetical protein